MQWQECVVFSLHTVHRSSNKIAISQQALKRPWTYSILSYREPSQTSFSRFFAFLPASVSREHKWPKMLSLAIFEPCLPSVWPGPCRPVVCYEQCPPQPWQSTCPPVQFPPCQQKWPPNRWRPPSHQDQGKWKKSVSPAHRLHSNTSILLWKPVWMQKNLLHPSSSMCLWWLLTEKALLSGWSPAAFLGMLRMILSLVFVHQGKHNRYLLCAFRGAFSACLLPDQGNGHCCFISWNKKGPLWWWSNKYFFSCKTA